MPRSTGGWVWPALMVSTVFLSACGELKANGCDASSTLIDRPCGVCGLRQCVEGRVDCVEATAARLDVELELPPVFARIGSADHVLHLTTSLSTVTATITASSMAGVGCFPGLVGSRQASGEVEIKVEGQTVARASFPPTGFVAGRLNPLVLRDDHLELFDSDGDGALDLYEVLYGEPGALNDPGSTPTGYFDRVVDWVSFAPTAIIGVSDGVMVQVDPRPSASLFDVSQALFRPVRALGGCPGFVLQGFLHSEARRIALVCQESNGGKVVVWYGLDEVFDTTVETAPPSHIVRWPTRFRSSFNLAWERAPHLYAFGTLDDRTTILRLTPSVAESEEPAFAAIDSAALPLAAALHPAGVLLLAETGLWKIPPEGGSAQFLEIGTPGLRPEDIEVVQVVGDRLWISTDFGEVFEAPLDAVGTVAPQSISIPGPLSLPERQPAPDSPWMYFVRQGQIVRYDRFLREETGQIQLHVISSTFPPTPSIDVRLVSGGDLAAVRYEAPSDALALLGPPNDTIVSLSGDPTERAQPTEVGPRVRRIVGTLNAPSTVPVASWYETANVDELLTFSTAEPRLLVLRSVNEHVELGIRERSSDPWRVGLATSVPATSDRRAPRGKFSVLHLPGATASEVGLARRPTPFSSSYPTFYSLDIGTPPTESVDATADRVPGVAPIVVAGPTAILGRVHDGEDTGLEMSTGLWLPNPGPDLTMDPVEDLYELADDQGWVVFLQTLSAPDRRTIGLGLFTRTSSGTLSEIPEPLENISRKQYVVIEPGADATHVGVSLTGFPLETPSEGRYRLWLMPYANGFDR